MYIYQGTRCFGHYYLNVAAQMIGWQHSLNCCTCIEHRKNIKNAKCIEHVVRVRKMFIHLGLRSLKKTGPIPKGNGPVVILLLLFV